MQVPGGTDTEMQEKKALWVTPEKWGGVSRDFARQKESRIDKGHLQSDHARMLLLIPPKYSLSDILSRA